MTLVSSGILNLKGSAGDPTRSIEYECEGAISGDVSLVAMQAIAVAHVGTLPTAMTDFYGYSACSQSAPGAPSNVVGHKVVVGVGYLSWNIGTNMLTGDITRIQYAAGPTYSSWNPVTGGGTGFAVPATQSTNTTLTAGNWKGRARSENCAGNSTYTESAIFSTA